MPTNAVVDIPEIGEVSLSGIVNRNERRVREQLPRILSEYEEFPLDRLAVQDVYALTFNSLSPRYTQAFSIVLKEPIQDAEIEEALRAAIDKVIASPKR